MDAEQAWQSALGQLQMEMPKASFDTWVRDTRLATYEDGLFTIAVRNAYTRDWLESRLSSTATNLLRGIMNRSVEVMFIVAEPGQEEIAEQEFEEEAKTESAIGHSPIGEDVLVEAQYDLAYDEIVVPEHVTLVPRYFLRHLRLLGPDLGWLYLGFRQAAFNAGARSGKKSERFSGKVIATIGGIAERTFWNRIGKAETWEKLRGLVSTSDGPPGWDLASAIPRRLPRRYQVAMTLPLTAADARSLRTWLVNNVERLGGPEKLIEAAAETAFEELLPLDIQAQVGDVPETVTAILRSLFAGTISSERLTALSTRLHKHIMPDTDRLGVTHFFVEHILPHLGTGPGWMLTLMRDRCFSNKETGEVRDQVQISGGYAEIASWIGITPETIWRWLCGKHSESRGRSKNVEKGIRVGGRLAKEIGKLTNPILSIYLQETTGGKVPNIWTSPRSFKVLLDEIPAEILEAALNEKIGTELMHILTLENDNHGVTTIEDGDNRAVCSIGENDDDDGNRTVYSIGLAMFTVPAQFAASVNPITARFAVSDPSITARFADDNRAICSIVTARFADDLRAVCRVFKSLNHLRPITNYFNSTNQPILKSSDSLKSEATENTMVGRNPVFSPSGSICDPCWDWDSLVESLPINPTTAVRLRQDNIAPWTLVAWLLRTLTMKNVQVPNLAISKVQNLAERYHAGRDFELLARDPKGLLREVEAALHPFSQDWSQRFAEMDETTQAYRRVSEFFASHHQGSNDRVELAELIKSLLFSEKEVA